MSRFTVVPEAIGEHAGRLSVLSPQVDEVRGRLASGAGAAADTPAAGALRDLCGHLDGRLSDFGRAADALHAALLGAHEHYASTEQSIVREAR